MADIQSNINVNIDTSSALASIKALQAQISAFHTSMARGSATSVTAANQLQQKLLDSVNATGAFRASIQGVKSTTESFTTALEKNKLSLGQYFKYSIASTKSFGNAFKTEMGVIDKVARERVKDLQTQYISLGRDANGALKSMSIRPLILDLENMQTKTAMAAQKQQILNQLLKQGSTNLLNFGKNTQWAGRQLMVGFTIPLSMAGTAAAKAYMDIEKASIKIKRVYGDLNTSVTETNRVVESIKSLATEYTKYGVAVAGTMEMAAKAAAMGKTGAELLAQVNEATRLSVLGGVEQEQALETTISLTNAFGLSADELAGKINFLNAVENQTVTSIEDLTIAIPKAGPVIEQLGGTVEDLTFFLTAMREGGINASEGANALKSGLASLINPTTKASEMLAGFGINLKAIVEGNAGNVRQTVIDFATALNTIDPLNRARAIEQMFGKFQFARISALLQNVTSASSQASKALGIANMSSIQLAAMSRKELDRVAASPMYKFQKAIADLQVKIAPVGEAFLKAVTPIISWVSKILEGFNGMSEQFKSFTVIGIAVIGGLAPVLLMVIGLVANGAANIIKLFANIKAFFNKTTSASQVLGETTNYLTTEQIKAEAVAASLDQIHTKLKQTFTAEAGAVDMLTAALQRSVTAQMNFGGTKGGKKAAAKNLAGGGMVYGPGTKTSDSIPANLSNGEAVIDADTVAKNPAVIAALFAGKKINIPGYAGNNSDQFAHVREDARIVSAGSLLSAMNAAEAEGKIVSRKLKNLIVGIVTDLGKDFSVRGYGGLGFSQSGDLNRRMRGNAPVPVDEFLSDFEPRGAEKWNKSVRMGGGNLKDEQVQIHLKQYDDAVIAGTKSWVSLTGSTTITSEQFAKIEAEARKTLPELSQLRGALDSAERGLFEVRANMSQSSMDRAGIETTRLPSSTGKGLSDKATGKFSTGTYVRSGGNRVYKTSAGAIGDIVLDEITRTKKDVISGVKKSTRQASPSKEAYDAGKNIGRGAIDGTKSEIANAKLAGIQVGESIAIGATVAGQLGPVGATPTKFVPFVDPAPTAARQSSRLPGALPGRMPSPFIQDVKDSMQNAMPRLRVAKQEFISDMKGALEQLKTLFKIGGRGVVDSARDGLIKETPRLVIAGKKMGFDYVAALKGGNGSIAAVVTSGNQKIINSALKQYSDGGFRVAGAIHLGLERGVSGSIGRAIVAGRTLAEAEISGVEQVAKTTKPRRLAMNEQGPLLPGQKRGNILQRAVAGYAQAKPKMASAIDDKMEKMSTGKLAGLGAAAMTATFALSTIPGPVGQFAQGIMPLISIVSMLGPLMSGLASALSMTVGSLAVAALPFIAAAAAIALVVAGIVIYSNAVADARKKEVANITKFSTATSSATNAMNEIKKSAGVGTGNALLTAAAGSLKGIGSKQLSNVNTLLTSTEYTDKKSKTFGLIQNIKKSSSAEAKAIFDRVGADLLASGATDQVVQDTIKALQIASGKTGIVFSFKDIKLDTKQGQASLKKDFQLLTNKAVAAAKVTIPTQTYASRNGTVTELVKTSNAYINLKASAEAFGSVATSQIQAISQQWAKGLISAKAYKQSMDTISTGFSKLSTEAKKMALTKMFDGLDTEIKKAANGIEGLTSRFKYLQIMALGGTVSGATVSLLNGTSPGERAAGEKALEDQYKSAIANAKKIQAMIDKVTGGTTTGGTTTGGDKTKDKSGPQDILANLIQEGKAAELNQKLLKAGYGSDFVSMIATADKATRDFYTNINGSLNTMGVRLLAAYNKKVITDFQTTQDATKRNIAAELSARKELTEAFKQAGLTAAQANEMAARSDVQATLQVIRSTVAKGEQAAAIQKVVDALIAETKAKEGLKTANEQFNEAYDKGMKYLDNQIAQINLEFDMDPKNKANKAAIKAANDAIQDLQMGVNGKIGLDQYNNALSKLQFREDEINKKYDERGKALDKVAKINQKISDQQKGQLSLAQALSSGDIAAAAMAAQELTAQTAQGSIEDQKAALEIAKQKEIDSLTVEINGKLYTRKEIEVGSKKVQEEILDIQIKQLAPATSALNLAERARDARIDSINGEKLVWDQWKLAVDAAGLSIVAYKKLFDSMPSLAGAAKTEITDPTTADKTENKTTPNPSTTTPQPEESPAVVAARAAVVTAQTKVDRIKERITASRKAGTVQTTISLSGQLADAEAALSIAENALARLLSAATTKKPTTTIMAATGGYISGMGTGTSDSIPAMLSNGEYVIKAASVKKFGVEFLDGINGGNNSVVPSSFSQGGFVVDSFSPSDLGMNRLGSKPTAQSLSSEIVTVVSNASSIASSSSAYTDASVYNYTVSVNVRSDANPDQIAQAVIGKINGTNSQRIRGNRF